MPQTTSSRSVPGAIKAGWSILVVIALLYVFLVGVQALSGGIKGLGAGAMNQYMGEDMNPILGLLVGILATTLVQSSSVTTSLVVGFVASGQMSVSAAIPMIMGANIGTTVTNTIASLAHATRSGEFQRAFAAATVHDFFNFLSVIVLLPVELLTRSIFGKGVLEVLGTGLAELVMDAEGAKYHSPLKASIKAGAKVIKGAVGSIVDDKTTTSILIAVVGCVVIFFALGGIVKVMRGLVISKVERYVNQVLGKSSVIGVVVGALLTILVQSSSITTSVLVPLAGAGLVRIRQVFPITVGANLGTTVTALLASMVVSGDAAGAARSVAFVHLSFNVAGMFLWFFPPMTREVPIRLAERLARFAAVKTRWAIAYVIGVFYLLPAGIFFLSRAFFG